MNKFMKLIHKLKKVEKCVLATFSSYHKHYPDTEFIISGVDKQMVNIKYMKYNSYSSICVPLGDIIRI